MWIMYLLYRNVSSNNLSSIYSSLPSMSPESVAAVRSMYVPIPPVTC